MVSASVSHPTPVELPTSLCERLEARIASGSLELPLLPHVANQVLSMSTAEDASTKRLAELIHSDQAIAAHVLQVANSPFYKPRVPIVSLQQAVSRLGLTTLREIVISVSMRSRMFTVPDYQTEARELWQHAVQTAAYAKEIARRCRRNVEGAFLGGLLHDVSKPVLLLALADIQTHLGEPLTGPVVAAALEAYHTQVGELLASTWTLPPEVCASMVYHHDPSAASAHVESVRVTSMADQLTYTLAVPEADAEALRSDPLWTSLNLYPDDVEALLGMYETIKQFAEAIG
ncbi:MAG: HDOD domain-containing protein [Candidatus Tectomicrobia bacterium]|uniref:HDOD domain-containing protein n=1 Tax=Tectimicrobiota bacterium TaxID=2528274 RepID=A0A938B3A7_UNCTE|nr:HDOD domain-containing protein [Candidatus Tectomicrobia bacterium]